MSNKMTDSRAYRAAMRYRSKTGEPVIVKWHLSKRRWFWSALSYWENETEEYKRQYGIYRVFR